MFLSAFASHYESKYFIQMRNSKHLLFGNAPNF